MARTTFDFSPGGPGRRPARRQSRGELAASVVAYTFVALIVILAFGVIIAALRLVWGLAL